jgi:hypothetical protein
MRWVTALAVQSIKKSQRKPRQREQWEVFLTRSDDRGELFELRSADFDFADLEEAGEKLFRRKRC